MLEKNLQALSSKNPALAQKLLAHQAMGVDFDQSDSGDVNMIYQGVHLHNTQDPQMEAKLIHGEDDKNENTLKLVFGLGLGYLFKRTYISSSGTIVVFEPIIDVLKATLENVDFSQELADNRVFIITDVSELCQVFYKYLYDKVLIMNLTSYKEIFPDLFDQVYHEMNKSFLDQRTNINKSLSISEAVIKNLPYVVKLPSAAVLKNAFKGKAALVVSAGPSLDKAIDVIKGNRSKFVIVAIGQAVKALNAADILPDFVVVIDMLPLTHQIDVIGELKHKLNLVLQPSVDQKFFKELTNTKYVYLPMPDYLSEWYADKAECSLLPQGCTVSIAAFSFARVMGANPIILIGQDLAYTDGKVYASNSIYDSVKYSVSDDGQFKAFIEQRADSESVECHQILSKNVPEYEKVLKVKGQNDDEVYTNIAYASFISHYNELAAEIRHADPGLVLINASEGGAFIEGFIHKPLKDLVDTLPSLDVCIIDFVKENFEQNKADASKIDKINRAFKQLLLDLSSLKEDAQSVVKLSNRLENDYRRSKVITNKLQETFKRLYKVDIKVKTHTQDNKISFIYPLIQKELFDVNKYNDKKSDKESENILYKLAAIRKFSEAMVTGANRTLKIFRELEEYPFKE